MSIDRTYIDAGILPDSSPSVAPAKTLVQITAGHRYTLACSDGGWNLVAVCCSGDSTCWFDSSGQLTGIVDNYGNLTTFTTGPKGLVRVTDPMGGTLEFGYLEPSNLTSLIESVENFGPDEFTCQYASTGDILDSSPPVERPGDAP